MLLIRDRQNLECDLILVGITPGGGISDGGHSVMRRWQASGHVNLIGQCIEPLLRLTFILNSTSHFSKPDEDLEREYQKLNSAETLAIKGLGQFERFKAAQAFRS